MLNRCQIDPLGGEGEADSRVGSGWSVPNKPLARHVSFWGAVCGGWRSETRAQKSEIIGMDQGNHNTFRPRVLER